jgi:NH3-dependent NAD+ synthetase
MQAGTNSRLTVVQTQSNLAVLSGSFDSSDTLVLALDQFGELDTSGFRHVIGG